MQLLDLMYTLHSQAAGVHQEFILNKHSQYFLFFALFDS